MDYEADIAAIRQEMEFDMGDPKDLIQFAEDRMARRVNSIISELDEICAMASNPETVDLVEGEQLAIGQMNTRVQLILSFLATRRPTLTVVRNNGR